ncbi:MAG: hypothetical protein R2857_06530 [Vampirovibrionales bacterium]
MTFLPNTWAAVANTAVYGLPFVGNNNGNGSQIFGLPFVGNNNGNGPQIFGLPFVGNNNGFPGGMGGMLPPLPIWNLPGNGSTGFPFPTWDPRTTTGPVIWDPPTATGPVIWNPPTTTGPVIWDPPRRLVLLLIRHRTRPRRLALLLIHGTRQRPPVL